MGKKLFFKDKDQELFERASKELIDDIKKFKNGLESMIVLCERIRERAVKEGFTEAETRRLGAMVFAQAELSPSYRRTAFSLLTPSARHPDLNRLQSLHHNPLTVSDRELYEGDYDIFIPYDVISKSDMLKMARGKEGWTLKVRNGKPVNAKVDTSDVWLKAESWEIEANLTRKELEAIV
jgi:hypothetical protein